MSTDPPDHRDVPGEDPTGPSITRRDITRGAFTGAVGTLLGAMGCAPRGSGQLPTLAVPPQRSAGTTGATTISATTSVRAAGALGDGATDDTAAIQQAVRAALSHGRVVHLPPGVYRIGQDLDLPGGLTCSFAHLAVIKPDPGVKVRIAAALDAGLHPIFDASPGAIVLTGYEVPVVYPEWWGARGAAMDEIAAVDSTNGLECALRAAHGDRLEGRKSRPCIPVALSSSYRLTRPLMLETNPGGFRLVGAQSVGSANLGVPTLFGDFPVVPGRAPPPMVTVRGVFGWTIENVIFHAGPGVGACLQVEATVGAIAQGAALRRCSFVAHSLATSLTHLVYVGRPTGVSGLIAGDDVCTLTFDGCYFDLQGRTDASLGSPPDGVVLRAANALAMLFTGCYFGGRARRTITCGAGTFALVSCAFHNPEPTGCDVYLEAPGLAHPGAFTAVHCESQSWRFLDTFTSAPQTVAAWPTVLVGVRHANVNAVGVSTTSLHWDAAGWCGTLTLVGCRFGGDVHIGPYATAVMDLGTGFTPHNGQDANGTLRRGGGFTGSTSALRGMTGLVAHPTHGTHGALVTNALRLGANLYRLGDPEPTAEAVPPPWSAGDVWLRTGTERTVVTAGAGSPGETTTLGATMHALRVARGAHHAWEGVFGSENYTGPYARRHDPLARRVTLDTWIVPEPGAVYEVLWDVSFLASDARAVGRDTVVVLGDTSGCRLASQGNGPEGGLGVALGARLVDPATGTERDHAPSAALPGLRLRVVLTGVAHDPGDGARVTLRRLI